MLPGIENAKKKFHLASPCWLRSRFLPYYLLLISSINNAMEEENVETKTWGWTWSSTLNSLSKLSRFCKNLNDEKFLLNINKSFNYIDSRFSWNLQFIHEDRLKGRLHKILNKGTSAKDKIAWYSRPQTSRSLPWTLKWIAQREAHCKVRSMEVILICARTRL